MTREQRVLWLRSQRAKYDDVRDWRVDMRKLAKDDLSEPFDEEALILAGVIERRNAK